MTAKSFQTGQKKAIVV